MAERWSAPRVFLEGGGILARSGTVSIATEGRNARPVALPPQESKTMIRRKPTYFRNSLDLRDKVQVKVLRRRLKVSDEQFADIFRKSGNSISAITKEAERAASTSADVQL